MLNKTTNGGKERVDDTQNWRRTHSAAEIHKHPGKIADEIDGIMAIKQLKERIQDSEIDAVVTKANPIS